MTHAEFEGHIRGLRPRIVAIGRRIAGTGLDVDDFWQDVCILAWVARDRFSENKGPFVAWLQVIARHRAIDIVRRTHRRPAPVPLESLSEMADTSSPCAGALARDRKRCLMARLNEKQRILLEGRLAGHTFVEIGAAIGHGKGHAVKILYQVQAIWEQMEQEDWAESKR